MKLSASLLCVLLATAALGCDSDDAVVDSTGPTAMPLVDAGHPPQGGAEARMDAGSPSGGESGCAVGHSVACTGPAGCAGGQMCRADGTFGACDCGATTPPPSRCSPEGTVAVCVGAGACSGLQVCGGDGRFGPCDCPAPGTDPENAVTGLESTAPLAGASVMGRFEVTGTATGHVAAVYVSIGNGPLLIADGTAEWHLSFDPAGLPFGPVTIVARAVGDDGSELQRWLQAYNVDPLVGTWYRTSWRYGNYRYPNSYCVLDLAANGQITADCYNSNLSGYSTWRRQYGDVIGFRGSYYSSEATMVATLSDDGEVLMIEAGSGGWISSETFARVHGDPPPHPDDDGGGIIWDDGGFDLEDAGL
jgi:hypothetical protein